MPPFAVEEGESGAHHEKNLDDVWEAIGKGVEKVGRGRGRRSRERAIADEAFERFARALIKRARLGTLREAVHQDIAVNESATILRKPRLHPWS